MRAEDCSGWATLPPLAPRLTSAADSRYNSRVPDSRAHRDARAERLIAALRESLGRTGRARLRAHGGSMWPWIRGGDELSIEAVPPADLRRGDVVLFARDARLFAHRLLRRNARTGVFTLKGDALSAADPPVEPRHILGRVVALRRGKRTIRLDTQPQAVLAQVCASLTRASGFWTPRAMRVATRLRRARPQV